MVPLAVWKNRIYKKERHQQLEGEEYMVSEALEKKLYDAASKGDVTTLVQLVEEDPYLVHGVSFPCSRNLLRIAAMLGQTAVVEEVLKLNPRLARISDSQKSSPLHIAVEEGHVEIQKVVYSSPRGLLVARLS